MDRRFLMVLALSAGFATCAAGLFYRFASSAARQGGPSASVPVVVCATGLPVGSLIRRADVKLVSVPPSLRPPGAFATLEAVQNRAVIAAIFPGEPVLPQRLAAVGSGAGLAPMIAPGQRAVSVRVNDVIGVAGFVQPGMRVDVLLSGRPPGSEDSVTRTVLQNVVVLSAGEVLQAEPKGQAIKATLVTLEVSPHDAEVLTLASGEGHIQLVLRNSTDAAFAASAGVQLTEIYGSAPATHATAAEPARAPVAERRISTPPAALNAAPPAATIEMIQGVTRWYVHFSQADVPADLPSSMSPALPPSSVPGSASSSASGSASGATALEARRRP